MNSILRGTKVDSVAEVLEIFETKDETIGELSRDKQNLAKSERRLNQKVTTLEKQVSELQGQGGLVFPFVVTQNPTMIPTNQ